MTSSREQAKSDANRPVPNVSLMVSRCGSVAAGSDHLTRYLHIAGEIQLGAGSIQLHDASIEKAALRERR